MFIKTTFWGIGMGNTCKPMAVSFQCMTKFTTNKKKRETKKKPLSDELTKVMPACEKNPCLHEASILVAGYIC